jgi:hypothetical protein
MTTNLQTAVSVTNASATMSFSGNNSVVDHNAVVVKIDITGDIASNNVTQAIASNDLQNKIMEKLSQSSVAALSWADKNDITMETAVDTAVKTNITTTNIQKCDSTFNVNANMVMSGDGSVIKDNVVSVTVNYLRNCIMGNTTMATTLSSISNTASQLGTQVSANPLDFITKIFAAIASSIGMVIGAVVIFVIAFVGLLILHHHRKKKRLRAAKALLAANNASIPPTPSVPPVLTASPALTTPSRYATLTTP